MGEQLVGPVEELDPGTVRGVGRWAVGNQNGTYYAVSRRCRHLGADLGGGRIDAAGCLVCPWHAATYDVRSGQMQRGPQGIFAKIPGLDRFYQALTAAWPLRRGRVVVREGKVYVS